MILLVKLPEPFRVTQKPTVVPPIGLWSLKASWGINEQVKIIDLNLIDYNFKGLPNATFTELLLMIETLKPATVGFSVQFSIQHTLYKFYSYAVRLHYPNITQIAGGFHASAVDKLPTIDFVHKGAGEIFIDKNLQWTYPKIELSDLEPYWKLNLPHDLRAKTSKWIPIEFSRGCVFGCGFCGVRDFWGSYQKQNQVDIIHYLAYLKQLGIEELFIEDDNVSLDKNFFKFVIQQIKKHNFVWSAPNGIYIRGLIPFIDQLAETNCWRLSLPFETGSERTAKLMNLNQKWLSFKEAQKTVNKLNEQNIETCGFFIIGYPGETLDDVKKTFDYANNLDLKDRYIYIATPYPGTKLYDICLENNYLVVNPPQLYDSLLYTKGLIKTNDFTPEQIEQLKQQDREEALKRRKQNAI